MSLHWTESTYPFFHQNNLGWLTNTPSTTRIVASLVRAQFVPFFFNLLRWLLVAVPATWTNSWLSYVESKLALAYRTRLTREVMGQYFGDESDPTDLKTFYKLANLDDRIKNPDQ